MPIPTQHLILVQTGSEQEAVSLAKALKPRLAELIERRVSNPDDRKRFCDDSSVDIVSVNYSNIWDLGKCNAVIEPILKERIRDANRLKTLILNLEGGTTAARTALSLTSIRLLRASRKKLLPASQDVKQKIRDVQKQLREAEQITSDEEHRKRQEKEFKQRIIELDRKLNHLNPCQLWVASRNCSRKKTQMACDDEKSRLFGRRQDALSLKTIDLEHPHSLGLLARGIGTKNPGFAAMLGRLEQIILTSRTEKILITGPTGVGKSELAKLVMAYMRALHEEVTEDNCIHLNVAAIPPKLIESELFGHEKGAFTDAIKQHKGVFERANNGVLFLDEIGELPKELQARLLTVLDGTPFTRVGGSEKITSDFLLLCGTNVNLQDACENGQFRRDLYERLRTWTVAVPSINDRVEDLEVALQRERGEWLTKTGLEVRFEKDAFSLFMEKARAHRWVGNFREFHATFVHLAMEADKGRITKYAVENEFLRMENTCANSLTISDTTNPAESAETEYDLADMARLACALDICRKCKTASEAGEMLFAARARMARDKGTQFNGASSLQRLFAQFGLKAVFKHGKCSVQPT